MILVKLVPAQLGICGFEITRQERFFQVLQEEELC